MKENIIKKIEGIVSYKFQNKKLLAQAFTRKSYAKEHPGALDNEVLEFIGDGVLSYSVLLHLIDSHTDKQNHGLVSTKSESQLTELRKKLVQKSMLAKKMDELGIVEYLKVGKGDHQQKVITQESIKEDLFEAIIGAVAIDCNFNQKKIDTAVKVMLKLSSPSNHSESTERNYIALLQEWCQKNGYGLPNYQFEDRWEKLNNTVHYAYRENTTRWQCSIQITGKLFKVEEDNKKAAKMSLAKKVINHLEKNDTLSSVKNIIGTPTPEKAINQLQELHQKGYIQQPVYEEKADSIEQSRWKVTCRVKGYKNSFSSAASSKKEAKKVSAFNMLKFIEKEGVKL